MGGRVDEGGKGEGRRADRKAREREEAGFNSGRHTKGWIEFWPKSKHRCHVDRKENSGGELELAAIIGCRWGVTGCAMLYSTPHTLCATVHDDLLFPTTPSVNPSDRESRKTD